MPQLSIIIVNWNSKDYLRKCLQSIYANTRGISFEIIVVDGASFDGCREMMAREFPAAKFFQSEKNLGFARANNLGVSHSEGSHLLFLNPDTELLEDSIRILMERLESLPRAGAVGCKLLNTDRTLQTSCVQAFPTVRNQIFNSEYLRRRFPGWKMWGVSALFTRPEKPAVVEFISGACILTRRKTFETVGGFTVKYFMYGEDADLCFKIKRAGADVYYVPETAIIHHGGGSSKQAKSNFTNIMMSESVYRFLQLNRGQLAALVFRLATSIMSVLRLFLILILLPFSKGEVVRHGGESLRKWFSILRWGLGLESWVCRYK
jgi:GT2 family glycosyltransferase